MKIGITGCGGKMGSALIKSVLNSDKYELSGCTEVNSHPLLGSKISDITNSSKQSDIVISDDPNDMFANSEVVIDFTSPSATETLTNLGKMHKTNLIIGTTGHSEKQLSLIEGASSDITIVKAMNFSIGVNVLFSLTQQLSRTLDDDFDIEIIESHHRDKVDSPSGTAIELGNLAAGAKRRQLSDFAKFNREGIGEPRKRGEIGFASIRGGDIVGEHKVVFAGMAERIELGHIATSRELFCAGALLAASWSKNKTKGLFDMLDVLGFK